ncbi:MAG TPA: urate oxidase [Ignavibacteria bacterium]|nr:urate oxidase [Ignavibacteria bacterium]
MPVKISHNNYGKSNVRILKVTKSSAVHEIKEMTVNIQLEGDFDTVHTEGDNRKVLPTDTMKNTVYALAKDHPVNSIEEFGMHLAEYYLKNNKQVSNVSIEIEEKLWNRILINNSKVIPEPHKHSFVSAGNEVRTAEVHIDKKSSFITSGIKDLLVLKTTASGFENYIKDKFTTLKETSDRIFSTSVKAVWKYANQEVSYVKVSNEVRRIILETFAKHHSFSVQQTLYETGKNILNECNNISEISISMPNKHYLPFNLEQFGMDNNNEIFIPTDEPFGLIEATLKKE